MPETSTVMYKNFRVRPLKSTDLKPYLDLLEQHGSIPFRLRTAPGETMEGTIQSLATSQEKGEVTHLEMNTTRLVTLNENGLVISERKTYPLSCEHPLLLDVTPNPKTLPSLSIRAGDEDLLFFPLSNGNHS